MSIAPPAEDGGHVWLPGGSHCSPGSTKALPQLEGRVVVVARVVVVVVLVPPHASQQLPLPPTVAVPPFTGRHSSLFVMLHFGLPSLLVRQHLMKPGFPHVDWAAQRATSLRQCRCNVPARTARFATSLTHATYAPWWSALAQSHSASACARTAATASPSPGIDPHSPPSSCLLPSCFGPPCLAPSCFSSSPPRPCAHGGGPAAAGCQAANVKKNASAQTARATVGMHSNPALPPTRRQ